MEKQQEYFGSGSINNLCKILDAEKIRRVFVVSGKNSFNLSGAKQKLEKIFLDCKCDYTLFSDFSPNPKLEEIDCGIKIFKREKYDAIIAIGGGSSIDVAKAIKLFYFNETSSKIPLVAVPTTSGSGSEATYFIVYYIEKEKQAKGIPNITLPEYSICDPDLTISLPKYARAYTGMDALSQAIESYWSISSTEESKKFSRESILLLINNLEKAVNTEDKSSKEKIMKAANLAGKSINITKTTACHAISYPITSYFKIPHGHAVALTLGEMFFYNSEVSKEDCLDKRGADYVKRTIDELINLIEAKNPYEARDKIKKLMENIGLETSLLKLGLKEEDIEIIIKQGFDTNRAKNNPRLLNRENLKKILKNIA